MEQGSKRTYLVMFRSQERISADLVSSMGIYSVSVLKNVFSTLLFVIRVVKLNGLRTH